MTGFFGGPPLMAHLLVVGLALAVALPLLADWLGSRAHALVAGLGVALAYALVALAWAARGVLRSKRPGPRPGGDTGSDP